MRALPTVTQANAVLVASILDALLGLPCPPDPPYQPGIDPMTPGTPGWTMTEASPYKHPTLALWCYPISARAEAKWLARLAQAQAAQAAGTATLLETKLLALAAIIDLPSDWLPAATPV